MIHSMSHAQYTWSSYYCLALSVTIVTILRHDVTPVVQGI